MSFGNKFNVVKSKISTFAMRFEEKYERQINGAIKEYSKDFDTAIEELLELECDFDIDGFPYVCISKFATEKISLENKMIRDYVWKIFIENIEEFKDYPLKFQIDTESVKIILDFSQPSKRKRTSRT